MENTHYYYNIFTLPFFQAQAYTVHPSHCSAQQTCEVDCFLQQSSENA